MEDAIAIEIDCRLGVRCEDENARRLDGVVEPCVRLTLKSRIARANDLVDQKDIRSNRRRDAKGEARLHAGRVCMDGHRQKPAELRERFDIRQHLKRLRFTQAEKHPHPNYIFIAGQLTIEACTEREDAGSPPVHS